MNSGDLHQQKTSCVLFFRERKRCCAENSGSSVSSNRKAYERVSARDAVISNRMTTALGGISAQQDPRSTATKTHGENQCLACRPR